MSEMATDDFLTSVKREVLVREDEHLPLMNFDPGSVAGTSSVGPSHASSVAVMGEFLGIPIAPVKIKVEQGELDEGQITVWNVSVPHENLESAEVIQSPGSEDINSTLCIDEDYVENTETNASDPDFQPNESDEESDNETVAAYPDHDYTPMAGVDPTSLMHIEILNCRQDSKAGYKCPYCLYTTRRRNHLESHIVCHSDEKPFLCDKCDFRSSRKQGLVNHARSMHAVELRYKCSICGFATKHSQSLKYHMRRHSDERHLSCPKCDFTAKYWNSLTMHLLQHTDIKSIKCELCDFTTKHLASLRYHLKVHAADRSYKCDQCDFTATSSSNLKQHQMIHSDERPHPCELCDLKFKSSSMLKKHVKASHLGIKPFRCEQCGKAFSVLGNLKRHQMVHDGPKELFSCPDCPLEFTLKENLKRHQKKHDNPVRFRCKLCHRTFSERVNLRRHINTVHLKAIQIPCQYCNKVLTTSTTLRRHIKSFHPERFSEKGRGSGKMKMTQNELKDKSGKMFIRKPLKYTAKLNTGSPKDKHIVEDDGTELINAQHDGRRVVPNDGTEYTVIEPECDVELITHLSKLNSPLRIKRKYVRKKEVGAGMMKNSNILGQPKKRGRPSKMDKLKVSLKQKCAVTDNSSEVEPTVVCTPKKKGGRPPKIKIVVGAITPSKSGCDSSPSKRNIVSPPKITSVDNTISPLKSGTCGPLKRKPGRPPKNAPMPVLSVGTENGTSTPAKVGKLTGLTPPSGKKRGRPCKKSASITTALEAFTPPVDRPVNRTTVAFSKEKDVSPPKSSLANNSDGAPKRRGRPPKKRSGEAMDCGIFIDANSVIYSESDIPVGSTSADICGEGHSKEQSSGFGESLTSECDVSLLRLLTQGDGSESGEQQDPSADVVVDRRDTDINGTLKSDWIPDADHLYAAATSLQPSESDNRSEFDHPYAAMSCSEFSGVDESSESSNVAMNSLDNSDTDKMENGLCTNDAPSNIFSLQSPQVSSPRDKDHITTTAPIDSPIPHQMSIILHSEVKDLTDTETAINNDISKPIQPMDELCSQLSSEQKNTSSVDSEILVHSEAGSETDFLDHTGIQTELPKEASPTPRTNPQEQSNVLSYFGLQRKQDEMDMLKNSQTSTSSVFGTMAEFVETTPPKEAESVETTPPKEAESVETTPPKEADETDNEQTSVSSIRLGSMRKYPCVKKVPRGLEVVSDLLRQAKIKNKIKGRPWITGKAVDHRRYLKDLARRQREKAAALKNKTGQKRGRPKKEFSITKPQPVGAVKKEPVSFGCKRKSIRQPKTSLKMLEYYESSCEKTYNKLSEHHSAAIMSSDFKVVDSSARKRGRPPKLSAKFQGMMDSLSIGTEERFTGLSDSEVGENIVRKSGRALKLSAKVREVMESQNLLEEEDTGLVCLSTGFVAPRNAAPAFEDGPTIPKKARLMKNIDGSPKGSKTSCLSFAARKSNEQKQVKKSEATGIAAKYAKLIKPSSVELTRIDINKDGEQMQESKSSKKKLTKPGSVFAQNDKQRPPQKTGKCKLLGKQPVKGKQPVGKMVGPRKVRSDKNINRMSPGQQKKVHGKLTKPKKTLRKNPSLPSAPSTSNQNVCVVGAQDLSQLLKTAGTIVYVLPPGSDLSQLGASNNSVMCIVPQGQNPMSIPAGAIPIQSVAVPSTSTQPTATKKQSAKKQIKSEKTKKNLAKKLKISKSQSKPNAEVVVKKKLGRPKMIHTSKDNVGSSKVVGKKQTVKKAATFTNDPGAKKLGRPKKIKKTIDEEDLSLSVSGEVASSKGVLKPVAMESAMSVIKNSSKNLSKVVKKPRKPKGLTDPKETDLTLTNHPGAKKLGRPKKIKNTFDSTGLDSTTSVLGQPLITQNTSKASKRPRKLKQPKVKEDGVKKRTDKSKRTETNTEKLSDSLPTTQKRQKKSKGSDPSESKGSEKCTKKSRKKSIIDSDPEQKKLKGGKWMKISISSAGKPILGSPGMDGGKTVMNASVPSVTPVGQSFMERSKTADRKMQKARKTFPKPPKQSLSIGNSPPTSTLYCDIFPGGGIPIPLMGRNPVLSQATGPCITPTRPFGESPNRVPSSGLSETDMAVMSLSANEQSMVQEEVYVDLVMDPESLNEAQFSYLSTPTEGLLGTLVSGIDVNTQPVGVEIIEASHLQSLLDVQNVLNMDPDVLNTSGHD